jgi:hypothetical protein
MAIPVPNGIIAIHVNAWAGAGWTVQSGYYNTWPRGAAVAGGGGGATTHTHTVLPHAHSRGSHTHLGLVLTNNRVCDIHGSGTPPLASIANCDWHTHAVTVSSSAGANITVNANVTLDSPAGSSEPSSYNMRPYKSDGTGQTNSTSLYFFWPYATSYLGGGWTAAGAGWRGRYVRFASVSGNYGTSAHSHSSSPVNHQHNEVAHGHTLTYVGNSGIASVSTCSTTIDAGPDITVFPCSPVHYHALNISALNAAAGLVSSNAAVTTMNTNFEPPCLEVNMVHGNGATRWLPGLLALWDGLKANIPPGWRACDGTDGAPDYTNQLIKNADADGQGGDLSGSLGHTHTANTHTHTGGTHSHTAVGTCGTGQPTTTCRTGGAPPSRLAPHTHTVVTDYQASSWVATAPTINSTDAWPPYTDFIIIEYYSEGGVVDADPPRPAHP